MLSVEGMAQDPGAKPTFWFWDDLAARLDFLDPQLQAASRFVARSMDTRLSHRCHLARIAEDGLYDLRMLEDVLSGVVQAAGRRPSCAQVRYAVFSDDRPAMLAALDDPTVEPSRQAWVVGELFRRDALTRAEAHERYRNVIKRQPAEWKPIERLANFLADQKDFAAARATISAWLEANADTAPALTPSWARTQLAEMFRRDGMSAEGLAALEPMVGSLYGPYLSEMALNLAELGRAEEALEYVRRDVERYPDRAAGVSLRARVYWCLGQYAEAAAFLASPEVRLQASDWDRNIAVGFVRTFRRRTDEQVLEAFTALQEARTAPDGLYQIARHTAREGRDRLAFDMLSGLNLTGQLKFRVGCKAYLLLKLLENEEAARTWLLDWLGEDRRDAAFAQIAYDSEADELTWAAVPEPTLPGRMSDGTWLLRAAAVVRLGTLDDHKDILDTHYRSDGTMHHHTIGRYLVGQASQDEVLAVATDPDSATEVAYYLGLKAESENRMRDASDWYRVAMEFGRTRNAEYHWATERLAEWVTERRFLGADRLP